ncbi:MAG: hypothetical protein ACOCWO_03425, partial [Candidatus Muiribacteriaceae bacterium]
SGNIQQSEDSKGNKRHSYYSSVNLRKRIGREWTITNKWDRRDVFGKTAFSYYDDQSSVTYRNTVSFVSGDWKSTLISYNYDLINDSFSGSAYSDIRYSKGKFEYYSKFNLDMNTMRLSDLYDREKKFEIKDVHNRISYDFEKTGDKRSYLRLTLPYDRSLNKITSVYAESRFHFNDLRIGDIFLELSRADIDLNWRKDRLRDETTALNYSVTFDLHCWEAVLKYDRNRKEGWLEFYVKAFSSKKHRLLYDAEEGRVKPIIKRIETD